MNQITIRFYGNLNDFLDPSQKQTAFVHSFNENPSIKDVIESLGIPHPEVDLILINENSSDFTYNLKGGEKVAVFPLFKILDISEISLVRPEPLSGIRFVLDVHLGKLAIYLRMLGIDTLYSNDSSDDHLADISFSEKRILLTFDRELLKRKKITYGYCVRSRNPERQLLEIVERYDLKDQIRPLERCLRCNDILEDIPKNLVMDKLPENIRESIEKFKICPNCQRIYWKGSHYRNMEIFINNLLDKIP